MGAQIRVYEGGHRGLQRGEVGGEQAKECFASNWLDSSRRLAQWCRFEDRVHH